MSHRVRSALLLVALVAPTAACGSRSGALPTTALETTAPAVETTVVETTAPVVGTTAAPTTVPTTTTTAASPPPESWIVTGREYYFPVQPPEAATYGRDHHDYPATDIFAAVGTPVVAVVTGVVDEMSATDEWTDAVDDPATRSGRYVTIVGDDGIRYHTSHLDSVAPGLAPGAPVYAGQQIGAVGNSGNAAPTPPHVHFGISHPTYAGDWEGRRGEVWPWPYLDAWREGEDVLPILEG